MKVILFNKTCSWYWLWLSVSLLLIFSIINSVQLKLVNNQNYVYQLKIFHDVAKVEYDSSLQKLNLVQINVYSITGKKIISKPVNISTRMSDILSPGGSYVIPVLVTDKLNYINILDVVSIAIALSGLIVFIIFNIINQNVTRLICFLMPKLNNLERKIDITINIFMRRRKVANLNWLFVVILIFIVSRIILFSDYLLIKNMFNLSGDFFGSFCQWDCGWYSGIVANGYDYFTHPVQVGDTISYQANWAFFPLFPLLIHLFNFLYSDTVLNAILFNQLLLFFSGCLLFRYVVYNYGRLIAFYSVALLFFSTENIYFLSVYTESLFLFLTIVALLLLRHQNFFLASIVVCLLSATRFIGFLFYFIVLYCYLKNNEFKITCKNFSYLLFLGVTCSLGIILYMIYLYYHVHDFLAFYHIQSAWGRNDSSWTAHPFNSLFLILNSGYQYDRMLLWCSIVLLIFAIKNKKWIELQLLVITILPEIASKSLISYSRFFMANIAVYILISFYLQRRLFARLIYLFIIIILQFNFIYLWISGNNYPA